VHVALLQKGKLAEGRPRRAAAEYGGRNGERLKNEFHNEKASPPVFIGAEDAFAMYEATGSIGLKVIEEIVGAAVKAAPTNVYFA
jgi:hypothetical protein